MATLEPEKTTADTVTTVAAANDGDDTPPSRLLRLPAELRIHIYDYLFASLVAGHPDQNRSTEKELACAAALLYASKAFFADAGNTFLKYNARLQVLVRCRGMCRPGTSSRTPERIWL